MDKVNFITTEMGTDIIISLSCDEGTEFGIDGFTMIRTPKYEFALMPDERGACINWDDETDTREIVKKITWIGHKITFESSTKKIYRFDLSRLSEVDKKRLWKTIEKINFDRSIIVKHKA
ncbi:MAG: hypothetical protein ACE5I1_28480 [bacterium]